MYHVDVNFRSSIRWSLSLCLYARPSDDVVSNDKDGGADKTGLLLYIVIGTLCGALTGLLLLTMLRVCLQFLASSRRTNDDPLGSRS